MSTNATISVQVGNKIHSIYNHWDGYPSHLGKTLLEHYNSQELAEKLVSFGDASAIYESCECPEGHSYSTPVEGYSIFYGRDRGETDVETQIFDSLDEINKQQYNYFWNGKEWSVDGKN